MTWGTITIVKFVATAPLWETGYVGGWEKSAEE